MHVFVIELLRGVYWPDWFVEKSQSACPASTKVAHVPDKNKRWCTKQKDDVLIDTCAKPIIGAMPGQTFGHTSFRNRCFCDRGCRCKERLQNDVCPKGRLAKKPTSSLSLCMYVYIYIYIFLVFLQPICRLMGQCPICPVNPIHCQILLMFVENVDVSKKMSLLHKQNRSAASLFSPRLGHKYIWNCHKQTV